MTANDAESAQRQKEQHAFFERLMKETDTAFNSERILDVFLNIGIRDYFNYLKEVCSPEDIEKYRPDTLLEEANRCAEQEQIYDDSEITVGRALVYKWLEFTGINTTIDKLLLEPFRMLGKEKKE